MDQEVLQDLYERAKSKGYSKSIQEFQQLISSDDEVLNDNFEYVKSKGYTKDISDFSILVGFGEKKKFKRHFRFKFGNGSYGIHYRNGKSTWLLGFFRGRKNTNA